MHANWTGQTDNADQSKSSHKSVTPGAPTTSSTWRMESHREERNVTSLAPDSLPHEVVGAPGLCLRGQPALQALGGGPAQPQRL
jgi:hypothetical protein